jgi:hypothetical protein
MLALTDAPLFGDRSGAFHGRSWFVAVTRIALCRGRMAAGGFRQPTSPDGEQMKAVGQFD